MWIYFFAISDAKNFERKVHLVLSFNEIDKSQCFNSCLNLNDKFETKMISQQRASIHLKKYGRLSFKKAFTWQMSKSSCLPICHIFVNISLQVIFKSAISRGLSMSAKNRNHEKWNSFYIPKQKIFQAPLETVILVWVQYAETENSSLNSSWDLLLKKFSVILKGLN